MNHEKSLNAADVEREFDAAPEWKDFGRMMTAAHDAVYVEPKGIPDVKTFSAKTTVQPPKVWASVAFWTRMNRRSRSLVTVGGVALVLLALGLIYTQKSNLTNNPSENVAVEEIECDWDADDAALDKMYQLYDRVENNEGLVDVEIAALDDTFDLWISESEENLF